MSIIKDNKKYERKTTQDLPLNIKENVSKKTNNEFNLDNKTIKEKQ